MKRRKTPSPSFSLDFAMLHLSGLDWIDALKYIAERDGLDMSDVEAKILAASAELAYEDELIRAVRDGWLYV